jgi:hypothetical protein
VQSQTVATWSNHPRLGHKLADELSVILWARGRTWITNAGYWPYGSSGRGYGESWEAANAPHLLGEAKLSERTSRVRTSAQGQGVRFIDMEREGPQGYLMRRQLVRLLDADSWIVLDYSRDSSSRSTITNWTFYPDLRVTSEPAAGTYRVVSQHPPLAMMCSFSGSAGVGTELVLGREAPFAGWVVNDRTPVPAPAIVVRQPSADSWSLATFTLTSAAGDANSGAGARMAEWLDVDHWTIVVSTAASGPVTVTRRGDKLFVNGRPSPDDHVTLTLTALADPRAERHEIEDAFLRASGKSKKFRELFPARVKVSLLLLIVFASQELVLFLMRNTFPRTVRALRIGSWAVWVAGGAWLWLVYFAVA